MSRNEEDTYGAIRTALLALEILRTLMLKETSGRSNDVILYRYLRQFALCTLPEELRDTARKLEQLGLVRTDTVEEYLLVALTDQGEAVAKGDAAAEGVARPSRG